MRIAAPPGVFSPPSDAYMLAAVLAEHAEDADVLDVGAGSGVLAVSAALSGARSVTAIDVSRRALAATRMNAALNGVHVRVRRGDLFEPVAGERFDVIASNPPYLPAVTDRRPHGIDRATEAGRDGRDVLDRLLGEAPHHLRPGGVLLVVHSSLNGVERSRALLLASGLRAEVVRRDHGSLGPLLEERAALLEDRGLLEPGVREEDLVVIRAWSPSRPRPSAGAP